MEIRHVCSGCGTGSFRIVEVDHKTYTQCKKCGKLSETMLVSDGLRPWRL